MGSRASFTPTDLNPEIWLDAQDQTTLEISTTNFVTSWKNKGRANGVDFVVCSSVSISAPTYSTSGVGIAANLRYLDFGAMSTGSGLECRFPGFSTTNEVTVVFVSHIRYNALRGGTIGTYMQPTIFGTARSINGDSGGTLQDFNLRYANFAGAPRYGFKRDNNGNFINGTVLNFYNNQGTGVGVWTSPSNAFRVMTATINYTDQMIGDVIPYSLNINNGGFGYSIPNVGGGNQDAKQTISLPAPILPISTAHMRLGADTDAFSTSSLNDNFYEHGLAEFFYFQRVLQMDERQRLEGWLAQKYNCRSFLHETLFTGRTHNHPYRYKPSGKIINTFNPTSISNCILWLDGADARTIQCTNGSIGLLSSVNIWYDKSITKNHMSTLISTGLTFNPPQFRQDPDGKTGIQFTRTQSNILQAFYPFVISANANALFAVVRPTTRTATTPYINLANTVTGDYSLRNYYTSFYAHGLYQNNNDAFSGGGNFNGAPSPLFPQSLMLNSTCIIDGNCITSVNTRITVGAQLIPNSFFFLDGYIYEIIAYNRNIGQDERLQVQSYLSKKWNVTLEASPEKVFFGSNLFNSALTMPLINPLSFNKGPILWLDAADPTSVTNDPITGLISTVRDKSGNGNNANGFLSTMFVNSSFDLMSTGFLAGSLTNMPARTYGPYNSIFTVFTPTDTSRGNHHIISLTNGVTATVNLPNAMTLLLSSTQFHIRKGTLFTMGNSTAMTPETRYVASHIGNWNGNNSGLLYYPGAVGSINSNGDTYYSSNFNNYVIGSRTLGTTFAGRVHEVLVWDRPLSALENSYINSYLLTKWNIPAPGSFPSTSVATFSPSTFTRSTMVLWLDAADTTTISTNASGTVVRWNDKSPNGYFAYPITTPRYRPGTIPAIDLTDGLSGMRASTIIVGGARSSINATVFAVVTVTANYSFNTTNRIIGFTNNLGPNDYDGINSFATYLQSNTVRLIPTGVAPGRNFEPNLRFMMTLVLSETGTRTISVNGITSGSNFLNANTSASASVSTLTNANIGIAWNNYERWGGLMHEFVVYNRPLGPLEIQEVEVYLKQKWQISTIKDITPPFPII